MKKALIVFGGWEGHEPGPCAELFTVRLAQRGFEVTAVGSLEPFADVERLATYDLIVPIWTMGTLTKDQEKGLLTAVQRGTGLAGFHGGAGDAFRGSIGFQGLLGGQFVSHPDNHKDYTVNLRTPADPIVAGLGDFAVHTEQYYMLVDPGVEVLATTTFQPVSAPWLAGVVMPVVWKRRHGAGRVFYSALGHSAQEFLEVPAQLELTLRGMAWAAR